MTLVVLLGGARSGKSDLATRLAHQQDGPVTVLATAESRDEEMARRIARHRADRPAGWDTVEEPLDVVGAVAAVDGARTLLLDCLTLWVANAMGVGWPDARIEQDAARLADALAARPGCSLVVGNEVGWGIVPADPDTRRFRDVHGRVNRILSERADDAVLVVAGRILPLTPPARHWPLLGRAGGV
jgi:adenosyl cobinamide kinase/adenosyl cobinamide phosphate guanylyltransferase